MNSILSKKRKQGGATMAKKPDVMKVPRITYDFNRLEMEKTLEEYGVAYLAELRRQAIEKGVVKDKSLIMYIVDGKYLLDCHGNTYQILGNYFVPKDAGRVLYPEIFMRIVGITSYKINEVPMEFEFTN